MPADDWIHEAPTLYIWNRFPLGLGVIGGVFLVAFGAAALWLVPTVDLKCQRQGEQVPVCEIEWRVLFDLVSIRRASVRELRAVEVDELIAGPSTRSASNELNNGLELSTEEGEVSLNLLGEWAPIESVRQQVANFLDKVDERELHVTFGPTGPLLWVRHVGTGVVLLGLFAWASVAAQIASRLLRGD